MPGLNISPFLLLAGLVLLDGIVTYFRIFDAHFFLESTCLGEIFLSCDGRASACHRIPPAAAGEDDPKGKSRRQGRQARTPHFLHSVGKDENTANSLARDRIELKKLRPSIRC